VYGIRVRGVPTTLADQIDKPGDGLPGIAPTDLSLQYRIV
jgi:hypothetical protein